MKVHSEDGARTSIIRVVDDDPASLDVIVECLQARGFRVAVSRNGESGLKQDGHPRPDLALLDGMNEESEERYRNIFTNTINAIYTFDSDKNFIDANPAGIDMLGYSKEELLQMRIPDVDADPTVVLPAHVDLLKGKALFNYEHKIIRKDGKIISVLNNSIPVKEKSGKIIGMQSILVDITERKRMEEALETAREAALEAQRAAEEANMAKSVFLANISHELRTPLSAILGFTRTMMNEGDLSPGYRKNLDIIHNRGEHLLSLINRIIEISRIEDAAAAVEGIDAVLKEPHPVPGDRESGVCEKLGDEEFATGFATLPSALVADLERAILNVDVERMHHLIERIHAREDALAGVLKDCIDDFEYEKMLSLIHKAKSRT